MLWFMNIYNTQYNIPHHTTHDTTHQTKLKRNSLPSILYLNAHWWLVDVNIDLSRLNFISWMIGAYNFFSLLFYFKFLFLLCMFGISKLCSFIKMAYFHVICMTASHRTFICIFILCEHFIFVEFFRFLDSFLWVISLFSR